MLNTIIVLIKTSRTWLQVIYSYYGHTAIATIPLQYTVQNLPFY